MKKKAIIAIVLILIVLAATLRLTTKNSNLAPIVTPTKSYIALGDSVGAGVGLPTNSDTSACDRTNESYPNLVARTLKYEFNNIACSGATIPAGVLGQQDVNNLMLPSQINQLFALPRPDLISITVGANDIDWVATLGKCYTGKCGATADTATIDQHLLSMQENLSSVLTQLSEHYRPTAPHVIVTSYYQVLPTALVTCADMTGIDSAEINWVRQQQDKLNMTIQNSIGAFTFARFALVDFSNHELCTSNSWVQGVNDRKPYHPTEEGQSAIAKQIVTTEQSFNK